MWCPFLYSKQNDRFRSKCYFSSKAKKVTVNEREITLRALRLNTEAAVLINVFS